MRPARPESLPTHAPREDAVDGRELARVGGHEAAHLREDGQHARLPQQRGLAWVWVGKDKVVRSASFLYWAVFHLARCAQRENAPPMLGPERSITRWGRVCIYAWVCCVSVTAGQTHERHGLTTRTHVGAEVDVVGDEVAAGLGLDARVAAPAKEIDRCQFDRIKSTILPTHPATHTRTRGWR